MSKLSRTIGMIAASVLLLSGVIVGAAPQAAQAANAADFNAGNIISDDLFFNGGAMSSGDVQGFLNGASGACRAGYTCLKSYAAATPSRGAVAGRCAAYQGSGRESAADIIAKVGAACGISQKAILVLLEKEQSLVTDTWPSDRQYRSAMGYGCPDTADCDTNYYGFFNQVYAAALQFKNYAGNPGRWNHVAGRVNAIRYNPDASCGSSNVFIENQATAGLYNYTPYQPNASALANLYGSGDGCGAYGNRNFWRIFTDWFGPTNGVNNPAANVEAITATVRAKDALLSVSGWMFDAINPKVAIPAHIYVTSPDGTTTGYPVTANLNRPDVGNAFPQAGPNHGFSFNQALTRGGDFKVCVYAIGTVNNNRLLTCSTVNVPQQPPVGFIEDASVSGSKSSTAITVSGWTVDLNAPQVSTDVHVYVTRSDGYQRGFNIKANLSRPDVAAQFPSAGPLHGYNTTIPWTEPGQYSVCAFVIGMAWQNQGTNPQLGCKDVNLISAFPSGFLEDVTPKFTDSGANLQVSGWTMDRGAPSAGIPVHIYVRDPQGNNVGKAYVADKSRPDVGSHGFNEVIPIAGQGPYQVCAYGIAVSPLSKDMNSTLGCKTVNVTIAPIMASFEGLDIKKAGDGSYTLGASGWIIDGQTPRSSSPVHLYVTGPNGYSTATPYMADKNRPDVGAVFPTAGANHGFAERISVPGPGTYQVCAYAIGIGPNKDNNPYLGCKTVSG